MNLFIENCRKYPFFSLFVGVWLFLILDFMLMPLLIFFMGKINGMATGEIYALLSGSFSDWNDSSIRICLLLQGWFGLLTWGLAGIIMVKVNDLPVSISSQRTEMFVPMGILMLICAIPLVQYLTLDDSTFHLPERFSALEASIKLREKYSQSLVNALLKEVSTSGLLLRILVLAIIPAICEELFFRGFVQQTLMKKYSPLIAIFLSALIFSAVHLQLYGFVPRLILGMLLGFLLYVSGSITPGIVAHACFNMMSIFFNYLSQRERWQSKAENYHFPLVWIFVSVLVVILLCIWADKMRRKMSWGEDENDTE